MKKKTISKAMLNGRDKGKIIGKILKTMNVTELERCKFDIVRQLIPCLNKDELEKVLHIIEKKLKCAP